MTDSIAVDEFGRDPLAFVDQLQASGRAGIARARAATLTTLATCWTCHRCGEPQPVALCLGFVRHGGRSGDAMTIAPDLVAQILRLHTVEKWRVGSFRRRALVSTLARHLTLPLCIAACHRGPRNPDHSRSSRRGRNETRACEARVY